MNEKIENLINIPTKKRSLLRRIRHHLWRIFRVFLFFFLRCIVPYLYIAYMKLVWMTSKVEENSLHLIQHIEKDTPHKSAVVLWHQDVFFVAWAYKHLRPHTIASIGDAGEVIARMLRLCNYTIFRGGSSKGRTRRTKILEEFIKHIQNYQQPMCIGITVDGSSGPIYRMKHGAIVMSVTTGATIYLCRVWCKRRIVLPTWDHTTIPLPFNQILIRFEGPYYPPTRDVNDTQGIEQFRHDMELKLADLTYEMFLTIDGRVTPEQTADFPPDWKPPKPIQ